MIFSESGYQRRNKVKSDAIIFSNVVVDLIKCYATKNDEDPNEILNAVSMSFKKEEHNDDEDNN